MSDSEDDGRGIILKGVKNPSCTQEAIIFKFQLLKTQIKFRDNFPLEITIKNIGTETIRSGARLELNGGDFYEKGVKMINENLQVEGSITLQVELEPTGNATIPTLPDFIEVYLLDKSGRKYSSKTSGFHINLANMMGDIARWKPKSDNIKKANIVVFGMTGAGKSTLINRIFYLWKEAFEPVAPAMQLNDHVTTESEWYQDHQGFQFLDTVGLSDHNYAQAEFKSIISGTLPVGFKINANKQISVADLNLEGSKENEGHAIIFVLPQGFRQYLKVDPAKINRLRTFVQDSVRSKFSPILVITRADEIDPNEKSKVKPDFSKITGIREADIFIVDNSEKDIEKDVVKERILFQILDRTLGYANTFIKNLDKKPISSSPSVAKPAPSAAKPAPSVAKPANQTGQSVAPAPTSSSPGLEPFSDITIHDVSINEDIGEIYGEYSPQAKLSEIRAQIVEQLGANDFDFINPTSGAPVRTQQESLAPLKSTMKFENGTRRLSIRTNSPPKYD